MGTDPDGNVARRVFVVSVRSGETTVAPTVVSSADYKDGEFLAFDDLKLEK